MMKISLFPRRLFARFCSFAKCDKSQPEIGCIKMCLEFPLLENRAVGENLYICFENLQKYFYQITTFCSIIIYFSLSNFANLVSNQSFAFL